MDVKRIVCLFTCAMFCDGSKILAFFPMAGPSHQIIFHRLVGALSENGHEITFITPFPLKKPNARINLILIPNGIEGEGSVEELIQLGKHPAYKISSTLGDLGLAVSEGVYSSPVFQDLIHSNEKFDLILFESLFLQEGHSALMHRFKAPGVDILGHGEFSWVNEISGLPDNPSYMIDFKSLYTHEMTFWERLKNAYITLSTQIVNHYYMRSYQKLVDQYFNYTGAETRPPLYQLIGDKAIILVNSHHSTGYPYPKAPHVKEVGGLHISKSNKLPLDIQKFMDEAQDGVIYFSLGTHLNMSQVLSEELKSGLFKLFGGLKQRVIWKWGSDNLPQTPPNVKLSKWLPQQDILSHRNIKLFITHGGYLSLSEAVYHQVPIIGIPFFGDQPKNMIHASSKGYGLLIQHGNLTDTSLKWAINEIMVNPRYKEKIAQISALFKDRIMDPENEAVYWIEYAIRNKNVLQPKSIALPFYALHLYDIQLFIVVLLFSFLLFISMLYLKIGHGSGKICDKKND